MKNLFLILGAVALVGCGSKTKYENEVMPSGAWLPVNQPAPVLNKEVDKVVDKTAKKQNSKKISNTKPALDGNVKVKLEPNNEGSK